MGGGEEDREVHDPGLVHEQDALEARDQSGQKGDLREIGDGQGKTRQDHRQGLRGGGAQEIGLSSWTYFCPGPGVRQSPVGSPREIFQVLPWRVSRGGVHVARLYIGGGLRCHRAVKRKKKKKKKKKVPALIPLL